jgi:hypothetical protein
MSFIKKRKKPYLRAAVYPNFPYLLDDEPDEVRRFQKHEATWTNE